MTEELLKDIPWETDVWREFTCTSRSVHRGQDAGVVTEGLSAYRDYRFAKMLAGKGKTRTLRVLVPVEPGSGLSAIITESQEPVPDGAGASITVVESNYYERPEVWKGYFARTGRRTTGAPALAIYLPRHGAASLFYETSEAGDQPQIGKLPARNDLQCVVRSAGKSAMQHALLPAAITGDATIICLRAWAAAYGGYAPSSYGKSWLK